MPDETLQQLVARLNASAYIPNEPLGSGKVRMAKQVKLAKGKEFTFKTAQSGGGQASKYPWDEWFNGNLLMIERSVTKKTSDGADELDAAGNPVITEKRDFDVSVNAMPAKLKTAARRRYKVVQISKLDADNNKLKDALIIKGRDMTAEERVEEDLLRAEEKAAKTSTNTTPAVAGTTAPVTHQDIPQAATA